MEIINTRSLSHLKLLNHSNYSRSPIFAYHSVTFTSSNSLPQRALRKLHCCNNFHNINLNIHLRRREGLVLIHASKGETTSTDVDDGQRWLLEPVGDGDSRHIGYKVARPGAIEIASSDVTVGRVPDKADIVIPVATVSAQHARIQNKDGNLLVTDLNSTNSTFINEKRLNPGVATILPPGSLITFGDTNLAIFRVSKLESISVPTEQEGDVASINLESSSGNVLRMFTDFCLSNVDEIRKKMNNEFHPLSYNEVKVDTPNLLSGLRDFLTMFDHCEALTLV